MHAKTVSPVFCVCCSVKLALGMYGDAASSSRSQQLMLPRLPLEPLRISAKRRSGHRANSPMARPKR